MNISIQPLLKKTLLFVGLIYLLTFIFFSFFEKSWIDQTYNFPIHNGGDSGGYFLLANNLIQNNVFSYSTKPPFELEALRSPGYPLFISSILIIFKSPIFISIIQLLLSLITGYLVYDLLKEKMEENWALVGALFFWINPSVLFYSITALSDILFTFLEVTIFYFLWKKKSISYHILAFFILGFAILVRPAGSYLGFVLTMWVFFLLKDINYKKRLSHIGILIFILLPVVTPWMYRNYKAFNEFSISSVGPYTLLFFNMEALKESGGQSRDQIEATWLETIGAESRADASSPKYSDSNMKLFKQELKSNLFDYFVFHNKGVVRFFVGSGISDVSQNTLTFNRFTEENNLSIFVSILIWLERLMMLIIAILFFISPLFIWKNQRQRLFILGSMAIALYIAMVIGPIPNARYRLSALPFIIIPAITSISILANKYTNNKKLIIS